MIAGACRNGDAGTPWGAPMIAMRPSKLQQQTADRRSEMKSQTSSNHDNVAITA